MQQHQHGAAVEEVRKSLLRQGVSVAEVVRSLQLAEREEPQAPVSKLPVAVVPNEDQHAALENLAAMLAETHWPQSRRALRVSEKPHFLRLLRVTKTLKRLVEGLERQALRPTWFNHFDCMAEHTGIASEDTPRNGDGWYLLADADNGIVHGEPTKATRELRRGQATITVEDLQELEKDGEITHQDFLALTKQTRVIDEERFLTTLAQRPHLLPAIQQATTVAMPTAQLWSRKHTT